MDKNTFLISDESMNSHGFKVLTDGINLTNFTKNPIMLYMHERPDIIGYWTNVQKKDCKLYADAVFDTESVKGKEIARQVEGGFIRASSLGIVELERKGDTVTKCDLVEISICDMGSNSNALKLYKDTPEVIHLSFNQAKENQELGKILGLSGTYNHTSITNAVKSLKSENTKLNLDLESLTTAINEEREKEAERLTDLAVKLGYVPENLRHIQKLAFKEDYEKTKADLQDILDKHLENERKKLRMNYVSNFIESAKTKTLMSVKGNSENTPVNKEEWTLTDYRKNAPEELEQNPELYQKLINEHYNK